MSEMFSSFFNFKELLNIFFLFTFLSKVNIINVLNVVDGLLAGNKQKKFKTFEVTKTPNNHLKNICQGGIEYFFSKLAHRFTKFGNEKGKSP